MINQEKKKIFEEHLKHQDQLRQEQLEKKKHIESLKNNPQEDMLYIQKEFRTLNQQMERLVAALKKGEAKLDDLSSHYNVMKNYFVEINYVLTTYDRQFYKEMLEKINNNFLEMKRKYEPKKKFKFSRRDEDFGVKEVILVEQLKASSNKETHISGIQNRQSQKITVTKECPQGGSFKIVNCTDVELQLLQKTEILFLKNLKNCQIRAAVTKSTVFVDHCQNCHFELNCHQLRIHNTSNSGFNIYVTSKAIIEDCQKIVFSPYTFEYPNRKRHEDQQQKTNKPNLWRQIQDFNWLKQNEKSPHFELVEQ